MVKLIAEIGINHNGSLETTKKLIDVASVAGCDYVKFQKRNIDVIYTAKELNSPKENPWGKTFGEYKRAVEFDNQQYIQINTYCIEKIGWFASVWDTDSALFMAEYDNHYQKIPSALITNMELLETVKSINKPVIISTGMSTEEEIDGAVKYLGSSVEYILHCTSTYPSKANEQNLLCIKWLKEKYPNKKIGFSNHSPGIIFIPVAIALGAEMIEFHITLDRSMFGSDQSSSIEPEGVMKIVKYTRHMEQALGDGKKRVYESEIPIMNRLRR